MPLNLSSSSSVSHGESIKTIASTESGASLQDLQQQQQQLLMLSGNYSGQQTPFSTNMVNQLYNITFAANTNTSASQLSKSYSLPLSIENLKQSMKAIENNALLNHSNTNHNNNNNKFLVEHNDNTSSSSSSSTSPSISSSATDDSSNSPVNKSNSNSNNNSMHMNLHGGKQRSTSLSLHSDLSHTLAKHHRSVSVNNEDDKNSGKFYQNN